MRLWFALLLALQCALAGLAAQANEAQPLAEDPVVEKRMVAISAELRCLVCQNESLAGSRADLALDLKREIRSLIKAGKSDAEIMDFMVSRYGDFVRYRPPVNPVTWLLVWPLRAAGRRCLRPGAHGAQQPARQRHHTHTR